MGSPPRRPARAPIYPCPTSDYERCIEALWQTAKHISSKALFLRSAQRQWAEVYKGNPDRLGLLIADHQDKWGKRRTTSQTTLQCFYRQTTSGTSQLARSGTANSPNLDVQDAVLVADLDLPDVGIGAAKNASALSREQLSIENFVSALGVDTEKYKRDVALLGCEDFVATIKSVSINYAEWDATRRQYRTLSVQRKRASKLQGALEKIDRDMKGLGASLESVLNISIDPAVGLGILGQRIQAKNACITSLVRKLWTFNASIVDKYVIRGMNRRVQQIAHPPQVDTLRFVSSNNLDMPWDEAYTKLTEFESQHKQLWPLTLEELLDMGHLIQHSVVIPEMDVLQLLQCAEENEGACLKQILTSFPLLLVTKGCKRLYINVHEYNVQCELLHKIFSVESSVGAKRGQKQCKRQRERRLVWPAEIFL